MMIRICDHKEHGTKMVEAEWTYAEQGMDDNDYCGEHIGTRINRTLALADLNKEKATLFTVIQITK